MLTETANAVCLCVNKELLSFIVITDPNSLYTTMNYSGVRGWGWR